MRVVTSKNIPLDFCRYCSPSEYLAVREFNDPGIEDNYFEFDAQHPDYDGNNFNCKICGWKLTEDDATVYVGVIYRQKQGIPE